MKTLFVYLFSLVLCCGCASTRFTSSIHKQPAQEKCSLKFRIAKVNFPEYGQRRPPNIIFKMTNKSSESMKQYLIQISEERYPNLFSSGGGEIPLEVSVRCMDYRTSWESLLLEIGTAGILGGILPLPIYCKGDLDVDVKVMMSDQPMHKLGRTRFSRKNYTWVTILTPIGLLPIPGESEKPKCYSFTTSNFSYELNMENIVDAIVKVLAEKGDLNGVVDDYKKSLREF